MRFKSKDFKGDLAVIDWSKALREKGIFENPSRTLPKGPKDLLKWVLTEKRTPWPVWVELQKKAELKASIPDDSLHALMVNHATVLLQTKSATILTDPVFSQRVSPVSWAGPKRKKPAGLKLDQLPKVDVVLISHNHYDHMDLSSLHQLWKKFDPWFLMPLENSSYLREAGIQSQKLVELDWWQSKEISKNLKVHLTPAQHWSNRSLRDRNKALWGGFWIQAEDHQIFFAGDTGYASHFDAIHAKYGAPDLSLLPIGAYEPRWFMRDNHMNPEDAVQAHKDLQSRKSLAIHWGTWQLTNEGMRDPVTHLQEALQKFGLLPHDFETLENGEHLALLKDSDRRVI